MRKAWVPVGAAVMVTVAACAVFEPHTTVLGPNRTVDAPPAAPAPVHARWAGCRAARAFDDPDGSRPKGGSVPADFVPVAVIWCENSYSVDPSGRRRGLERRSTEVRPLLDYLALPSKVDAPGSDAVCTADAELFPWLVLLDAGKRWVYPVLPTTECNKTRPAPGGGAAPWSTLRYTDRLVCVYRQTADGSVCR